MAPDEAIKTIYSFNGNLRRPFNHGEVERAVSHAYTIKVDAGKRKPSPPKWCQAFTNDLFAKSGYTRNDMALDSPVIVGEHLRQAEILESLFPADALVCVGRTKNSGYRVGTLAELGDCQRDQFIVPCMMKKREGKNQNGLPSKRCLDNTGNRLYIVCDFDSPPPEHHAAIARHLAQFRPMALALYSGGKSLHAWYQVTGNKREDELFFNLCVRCGADPALAVPCQFVRLPLGLRDGRILQEVYHFNPEAATR